MATTFLRKIILEELKKVLKEDWFTDNVADDTGTATYTPYQKETPEVVDLGTIPINVKKSKPVNPNTVAIIKIQKSLRKIMGPEYKTSWPKVSGVLDKHTKKLIKILYPRLNLDKITNFRALSTVFQQRVERGGLSIDGETFDQQLDKAVAASEKRRAEASAGIGKEAETSADVSTEMDKEKKAPTQPEAPSSQFPPSVAYETGMMPSAEYTPKEGDEMKGERGPEIYHNGEWIPKSEYEQLQKGLDESLVRAISKLLKTL